MKLSLSARVAESFSNKRDVDIQLPELARIARNAGYQAICMRAAMVGVEDPEEKAVEVRKELDRLGLEVSMVTGDFAVPENREAGPGCLRNITPHLDLAKTLRSDLIRICMKEEADIGFAQKASDEGRERGIRLAHQSHTRSLFETVQGSLEVLAKVGRSNFGIIYEPANLALCLEDYGPAALKAFEPYLVNVYLQNHVPDPNGDREIETWVGGKTMSTTRPLEEPRGVDFQSVFEGLKAIRYDGYVTLHQAFGGNLPPKDAAVRSAEFLRGLMA